jgi:hypothetical protein
MRRVRYRRRRNKGSVFTVAGASRLSSHHRLVVFPFEALLQLSTKVKITRRKILVEWWMRLWGSSDIILYKYFGAWRQTIYSGWCEHWLLLCFVRERDRWYFAGTDVSVILVIMWGIRISSYSFSPWLFMLKAQLPCYCVTKNEWYYRRYLNTEIF